MIYNFCHLKEYKTKYRLYSKNFVSCRYGLENLQSNQFPFAGDLDFHTFDLQRPDRLTEIRVKALNVYLVPNPKGTMRCLHHRNLYLGEVMGYLPHQTPFRALVHDIFRLIT